MKFKNDIEAQAGFKDAGGDLGVAGQLLSSTGTETNWIDQSTIASGSAEVVEVPVKNLQGSALTKGDPVYISGSVGASGRLEVQLADAGNSAKMPAVGLLKQDLAANAQGFVVVTGKLRNLITSPIDGVTPNPNTVIYVKSGGSTGAALTTVKPGGSTNLIQNMGKVGRVSTSSDGTLVVSSILRSNDVPNLPLGRLFVGTSANTSLTSDVVYIDDANDRVGIGTTSPSATLEVKTGTSAGTVRLSSDGNGAIFSANGDLQFYTNNTAYATKFYSANKASTLATILDSGKVLVGVTGNQTQSKLTSRQNGSAIEFGHLNQSGQYYGTLGAMSSSGSPFIAFSADNSTSNSFTTRGAKGFVISQDTGLSGDLIFSSVPLVNTANQSLVERMRIDSAGKVSVGSPVVGQLGVRGTTNDSTAYSFESANLSGATLFAVRNDGLSFFPYGNVGIGTTSPAARLDVVGNGNAIQVRRSNGYASIKASSDNGGNLILDSDSTGAVFINNYVNRSVYIATGGGNVGIGTTSPLTKLDVSGGVGDGATYDSIISLSRTSSTGNVEVAKIVLDDFDTNHANLVFRVKTTASSAESPGYYTDALTIKGTNGNVGIGTTSPATTLQVYNSTEGQYMEIGAGDGGGRSLVFTSSNNNGSAGALHTINAKSISGAIALATAGSERMRITNTGNVGIGVTAPSAAYRLDIGGGDVYVRDAVAKITLGQFGSQGDAHFGASGIGSPTVGSQDYGFYSAHNAYRTSTGAWKHSRTSTIGAVRLLGSGGGSSGNSGFSFDYSANVGTADITWTNLMQIMPSGNVGIGTTSPNNILSIRQFNTSTATTLELTNTSTGGNTTKSAQLLFMLTDTVGTVKNAAYVKSVPDNTNVIDASLTFATRQADISPTERMRITSAGGISFGSTGTAYGTSGQILKSNANASPTWVDASTVIGGPYVTIGTAQTITAAKTFTADVNVGAASTDGAGIHLIYSTTVPEIRIQAGENGASAFSIYNTATSPDAEQFFINNNLGSSHLGNARGALKLETSAGVNLTLSGSNATFAGTVTAPTFLGDLNGTINTATTGVTQTAGNNSTLIATTAYADAAAGAVPIGNYLPLIGGTMTGTNGVLFPDNFKLNIGTGSDLQIYHDGSNSYINESGTGRLILSGGSDIQLQSPAGELMADLNSNGSVDLYYDNSKKFETTSTGVSVTGIVEATGGNSTEWNTAYDNSITAATVTGTTTKTLTLTQQDGGTVTANWSDETGSGITGSGTTNYIPKFTGTTSLGNSLVYDNGTNVGIGTTNPATKLTLEGAKNTSITTLRSTTNDASWADGDRIGGIDFYSNDTSAAGVGVKGSINYETYSGTGGTTRMTFKVAGISAGQNNLEAMRIDAGGNVGINTTAPTEKLAVTGNIETTETANGVKIGFNVGDSFTLNGADTAHYGLSCGSSTSVPLVLSGYYGVAIATNGLERVRILQSNGYVGILKTAPSYALDVTGTIRATGNVIAFSDARVKENIKTIDSALEKVNKLRGVEFNKIGEEKTCIGVIAQEVEEVLPEVVETDDNGMKAVAYGNMVGLLIEAMKEQQKQIDELKAKLESYGS
jgi:hypothetical protein